jgi:hypothetical protein
MANEDIVHLKAKLEQARHAIEHLMDKAACNGAEAQRVLAYFSNDGFDPDFLPWPRQEEEGLRPEELNAANDG